ncbi:hypothetical protein BpHYR1_000906 [Brachionus plicatilis]|uniref:Uncharacterized protein n=1 Tax=Brachionus plicatilis TaxID=10195 RepID=A0A3M7SFM7_BRAPC|nr:hypothetical protein BpHYR1_000906 [Brachionus plicatilis]
MNIHQNCIIIFFFAKMIHILHLQVRNQQILYLGKINCFRLGRRRHLHFYNLYTSKLQRNR